MIDESGFSGVKTEGKKFLAIVNGETLATKYGANGYRAAEIVVERALGLYARKPRASKNVERNLSLNISEKIIPTDSVSNLSPEMKITLHAQNKPFVPVKDSTFVPFGNFTDIDTVISSRMFYPIFITGSTGNGKSMSVEQACAKHKRSFIRLQINSQTDEDQLIGTKTLVDGNIEIVEGPVLIAMRTGSICLLDELDCADPGNIMCLQGILEGRPYYFKLKNEIVHPSEGFNIIATGNTKGRGSDDGRYIGTKILNEAFLERFPITLCQEYPSPSVELKIVKNVMDKFNCMNENFAQTLVKWADIIRRTYEDGAIDDLITTRRLVQIVRGYSIFGNTQKAVEIACNRFDSVTKSTFIDVFDKIMPDDTPIVEEGIPVFDVPTGPINVNGCLN